MKKERQFQTVMTAVAVLLFIALATVYVAQVLTLDDGALVSFIGK